jgi:hypothetical protein
MRQFARRTAASHRHLKSSLCGEIVPTVAGGDQPSGFIVRLMHRSFGTVEFLAAAGNFSLANLTPNRWEAWRFPTRASALAAVRLALGFGIKSYNYPARS